MKIAPENYPICWLVENGDDFHYDFLIWKKETNSVYYFSKPEPYYCDIPEDAVVISNISDYKQFNLMSRVSNMISKLAIYEDVYFDPELCWIKIIS